MEPEEDYDTLRKELREVFMLYDKEARGYLPLDEFKKILREIDPELPEDELDEIIDEIDADGSGTIDFDGEFSSESNWACTSTWGITVIISPNMLKFGATTFLNSAFSAFSEFMDVMAGSDWKASLSPACSCYAQKLHSMDFVIEFIFYVLQSNSSKIFFLFAIFSQRNFCYFF